jgi:hypothetical protein
VETGFVNGNLIINSGAPLTVSGIGGLIINGNWTNNGTYSGPNTNVFFSGTGLQNIGGTSVTIFGDAGNGGLWMNNSGSGVILSQDVTVNGDLLLGNGIINGVTNNKTLTMGPVSSTGGGSDVSHV